MKAIDILKSKTGASLIFVLCIMLLLMGIGGSALFAAEAASGSGADQRAYDQLVVCNQSVIKAITYQLCKLEDPELLQGDESNYLGYLLPADMANTYNRQFNTGQQGGYGEKKLLLGHDAVWADLAPEGMNTEIKLTFPEQNIKIIPYVNEMPPVKDADGNIISEGRPREPQKADVAFTMAMTIESEYKGKKLKSVATYDFTGGYLEDDGRTGGQSRKLLFKNFGNWRMTSCD